MNDVWGLIYDLELFGAIAFAAAGALEAGRKHMDYFGVLVLAMVTAFGGGTLRDIILNRYPVSWVADPSLIWVAVAAATATFLLAKRWRLPYRALLISDALGLGAFTVSGAHIAIESGWSVEVSVVMGMASGIVGGIIRDVLANDVPLIFQKDIYATAAFLGALTYYNLEYFMPGFIWSPLIGMLVVVVMRLLAIRFHWSLPGLLGAANYREQGR